MEFLKVPHKIKINKKKMYGKQVTLNQVMNSPNNLNKLTHTKEQLILRINKIKKIIKINKIVTNLAYFQNI